MSFAREVWQRLSAVNVNKHTEKKNGLTYLSWSWAWGELMKMYPESSYEYMPDITYADGTMEVRVQVTVKDGEDFMYRTMHLAVMDYKNTAVSEPSCVQVANARMRCLTKCISMFGLGHYIYAGEDLPAEPEPNMALVNNAAKSIIGFINSESMDENQILSAVQEIWHELGEPEKKAIWVAKTKGGYFTQQEKEMVRKASVYKPTGETE